MRRLVLAPAGREDAAAALRESRARFGAAARARYGRLLSAAYADLQADPERLGVRPAGVADLCLYPIRHSRARLPPADRVGRPRHLIVFTFDETHVRILRVLHDGMDVARHVSGER